MRKHRISASNIVANKRFELAYPHKSPTKAIQTYKPINFDTLKHRHDNFSFEKAIETKHLVYDTLHFQDMIENQLNPNLILLQKKKQTSTTMAKPNRK